MGRNEVRVRVRGMERANLKPNHLGIPALIPVMAQHKFFSWPPPLLNLLPVLLPDLVLIA